MINKDQPTRNFGFLPYAICLFALVTGGCSQFLGIGGPGRESASLSSATSQPSLVNKSEHEIWNDPTFKKQFIAGYGVNADVEPRITVEEMELLDKIRPMMEKDRAGAKAILLKEMQPDCSSILDFTLGSICFQQEKYDEALQHYQTAIAKFPSFRRAWRNIGLIYARSNNFDESIKAFTKMIELGGGDAYSYGLLGIAYASKKDFQAGEVAFRNALLLQPENTEWRLGLTRCVLSQQKYEDAVTLLNTLLERYPDKSDFWMVQADAYMKMKQPRKAAQNLEAVDRLGKADSKTLYLLGNIYVREDLPDLATRAFVRAVDVQAKQFAGAAQVATSQPTTAPASAPIRLEQLAATTQIASTTQPASTTHPAVATQPAIASTRPASTTQPAIVATQPASQPAESAQSLAGAIQSVEALLSVGALPQARQVATHIHKVCDNQMLEAERRKLLKVEARVSMAEGTGGAEGAKLLEEIVKLDPLDGEALMLLGQHYTSQGQPDRAIFYYERAESLKDFEVKAKTRHAQVLVGMRRYSDAVPLLRSAQEIKPREDVARYLEQVERFAKTQTATSRGS